MVKKKISKKKIVRFKKTISKKKSPKKKINPKEVPTLKLKSERDIAMDFATKTYQKFNKIVKSIILFGSTIKKDMVAGSDIDIIIVIDDVSINWDQELISWYREELDKMLQANPYQKSLHINTMKLSLFWEDLLRGDPLIINVLRHGETLIDFAGFFNPLKSLLLKGKIRSTPEAIYNALQRAPMHIARSKVAELNSIEGLYWAMVDSAHAALMAANVPPASPEHIPIDLKTTFVDAKKLDSKYVAWFRDLNMMHKKISHGDIKDLKGVVVDEWQARTEDFLKTMAQLVKDLIEK